MDRIPTPTARRACCGDPREPYTLSYATVYKRYDASDLYEIDEFLVG
jgi:hypothetical protein